MDKDTLLHRQIHPSWVQNNVVSSLAFTEANNIASLAFIPSEKDDKKLSVYNGEKFTAESAYDHYVKQYQSCGVLSITKSECESVNPLTVSEDNIPFNGHVVVDFTGVDSISKMKKKGQTLRNLAIKRGWSYRKK